MRIWPDNIRNSFFISVVHVSENNDDDDMLKRTNIYTYLYIAMQRQKDFEGSFLCCLLSSVVGTERECQNRCEVNKQATQKQANKNSLVSFLTSNKATNVKPLFNGTQTQCHTHNHPKDIIDDFSFLLVFIRYI